MFISDAASISANSSVVQHTLLGLLNSVHVAVNSLPENESSFLRLPMDLFMHS